ncbi:MAG: histidine kinase [Ramlibacter sp.]|nr:histidine kinase [Ramlibacter sp.]
MLIDWVSKLRNFLQVLAFAMAVATIQYAFLPDRPYGPPVVFSLLIATLTWGVIDLGREFFPSAAETGWPQGWQGPALVATGILVGYLGGTALGDALCRIFQFYPPGSTPPPGELRTSILITVLAGSAGSYYFYNINKGAYLERKMAEARQHANEARLKVLETQLEPHMLFNTLANLRVLIGTDTQRAQQMLDHMIAYLRATLSASRNSAHPLQAEFDRLRDYLELMAVRMGPRLSYTLDLPDTLASRPVPPLLLQPLVENAIKHGLEPKVPGGHIRVAASQQEGELVLEVADTGVGLPAHEPDESTVTAGQGFGVSQVRERLATAFGPESAIELVAQSGGGTRAIVRFPSKP